MKSYILLAAPAALLTNPGFSLRLRASAENKLLILNFVEGRAVLTLQKLFRGSLTVGLFRAGQKNK